VTQAQKENGEESAERDGEFFHTDRIQTRPNKAAGRCKNPARQEQKMPLKKLGACIYTNVETGKEAESKCP
jgi:hypothetical protein